MKKIYVFIAVIILQLLCANLWSAEDKIVLLQNQISNIERQKSTLEAQKQQLVTKGDELSNKIESLKMQSGTGLGVIGKYRLSKALREAQTLSEKVQSLEKDIYIVDNELKNKKNELEKEYESQISMLVTNLDKSKTTSERRQILEKLNKYRSEKEKLGEQSKRQLEHLDVGKIEIKEYDSPQDIREKADLIDDYTAKLNDGIRTLSNRIEKLRTERKTRIKLGEFAEEISFFGERVSKEEVTASATLKSSEPIEKSTPIETDAITRSSDATAQPPTADNTPITAGKMVIERNGVSADFIDAPLDQLEKEIKLLEKRKQELEKEKTALSGKARSFYKKADEIEKSETKAGAKRQ